VLSRRAARRLTIIVVLITSMLLTLVGRLYYVQVLDPHKPTQAALARHDGVIVIPAPRGLIVDARGRPIVDNSAVQVVTVDREALLELPDQGVAVLQRLADLLGTTAVDLAKRITPCSPTVPAPCWTGEPYAPVPVAIDAPQRVVLAIGERREEFPGVTLQTQTHRDYPYGTLAAHLLGYPALVNAADQKADPALVDVDTIGRGGLEQQYDSALRGVDGKQILQLDPRGYAVAQGASVQPVQGDTLVTSIDLRVQQLAEQSLREQIAQTRAKGKPATSGAVVVMDPNTGRVIAAASYPTFDPGLFVGGISTADYAALTAPSAGDPLLNRATAGQYAPGSTFKLITSASLVKHGQVTLDGSYPCPGTLTIDGRVKTNFESEGFAYPLTLRDALGYSCDTFFYAPAAAEYYADQARVNAGQPPHEYLQQMAAEFGVGVKPGIDLPAGEQASGSYADRETRMARWKKQKADYCATAKRGYPDVADPAERAYLTQLASENCTDGWRYRAGDNADMSIGQGETTMSPLQLAVAYSAMLNGGKIFEPTLGWSVLDANGKNVRTISPKVRDTVPLARGVFDYIADSLSFARGWAVSGAFAYMDSPYRNLLGGKTGTAEVYGKQDTSWIATWGPTSTDAKGHVHAKYVVVGMIEQGGTGATAAGPMVKRIWDGLMGVTGGKPIVPATKLPKVSLR
jgi:penicillin-binding protein 2